MFLKFNLCWKLIQVTNHSPSLSLSLSSFAELSLDSPRVPRRPYPSPTIPHHSQSLPNLDALDAELFLTRSPHQLNSTPQAQYLPRLVHTGFHFFLKLKHVPEIQLVLKTLTGYKPLTLSLSLSQHVRFFQLHHETGSHPIEVTFLWPYWRQWSGIRGQYLRTMYICILFSKFIDLEEAWTFYCLYVGKKDTTCSSKNLMQWWGIVHTLNIYSRLKILIMSKI